MAETSEHDKRRRSFDLCSSSEPTAVGDFDSQSPSTRLSDGLAATISTRQYNAAAFFRIHVGIVVNDIIR